MIITPFDCTIQKTPKVPKVINRPKINDRVIIQINIGIEIIIARRVPLVPDIIPANQNPISRQTMVINLSAFFEWFQLDKQNIEMPKTAVEKGIGLPENISNLPRKWCVSPNSNAKLFKNIIYIKKVAITAIFALFSNLCAVILKPSLAMSSIANPIIGIGNIGLRDSSDIQGSL